MEDLLDETEEYIKCAHEADDPDLKSAYHDLARCHFDGFEKLSNCCERAVERKAQHMPDGQRQVVHEMTNWHKEKYDDRAIRIKEKLNQR